MTDDGSQTQLEDWLLTQAISASESGEAYRYYSRAFSLAPTWSCSITIGPLPHYGGAIVNSSQLARVAWPPLRQKTGVRQ